MLGCQIEEMTFSSLNITMNAKVLVLLKKCSFTNQENYMSIAFKKENEFRFFFFSILRFKFHCFYSVRKDYSATWSRLILQKSINQ